MNIKELVDYGAKKIEQNNLEDSKLKAKILLTYLLSKSKEYLIINSNMTIDKEQESQYLKYINEICNGKPLQYITNRQEFFRMNFFVNENVLIPRPDTEILVEEVIKISENNFKILDLCTGSGAIAIALAKNIENVNITAVDISEKALEVANINANNNEVNIKFVQSDLFSKIEDKNFDIIVSNPPYIETKEIETLNKDVKQEPVIALDGGIDGLYFYKNIIQEAPKYLKQNGYICFEIGYNQKNEVINILNNSNMYYDIFCKKDLSGMDRVIIARLK